MSLSGFCCLLSVSMRRMLEFIISNDSLAFINVFMDVLLYNRFCSIEEIITRTNDQFLHWKERQCVHVHIHLLIRSYIHTYMAFIFIFIFIHNLVTSSRRVCWMWQSAREINGSRRTYKFSIMNQGIKIEQLSKIFSLLSVGSLFCGFF